MWDTLIHNNILPITIQYRWVTRSWLASREWWITSLLDGDRDDSFWAVPLNSLLHMHIGQWHGRSRSWCTAQPGNGMLVLWKFEVTAQRNLWIELLGEISMGWGSGDLLEQTFCKPYCEVLRDMANNLTGGKFSIFIGALSLSFPSAKNKHCSHWMMKSVRPLFFIFV